VRTKKNKEINYHKDMIKRASWTGSDRNYCERWSFGENIWCENRYDRRVAWFRL